MHRENSRGVPNDVLIIGNESKVDYTFLKYTDGENQLFMGNVDKIAASGVLLKDCMGNIPAGDI